MTRRATGFLAPCLFACTIAAAPCHAQTPDAHFLEHSGNRTLVAEDEGAGYYLCPSAAAVDTVIDALARLSGNARDVYLGTHRQLAGCRPGKATILDARARRVVASGPPTYLANFYAGTGHVRGKLVNILIWVN